MPPCTMPNRDCVSSEHVGTDAFVSPDGRSPEFWAEWNDSEVVPPSEKLDAELLSEGRTNAAVPTRVPGTSCLCSSKYFLLRAAQRAVISIEARIRAWSAGYSVHSSNAMMMSAPSPICASIALSGLKKCEDPSRCDRNVTPSSLTLRNSFKLN